MEWQIFKRFYCCLAASPSPSLLGMLLMILVGESMSQYFSTGAGYLNASAVILSLALYTPSIFCMKEKSSRFCMSLVTVLSFSFVFSIASNDTFISAHVAPAAQALITLRYLPSASFLPPGNYSRH